jgi:hypothetical protein
MKKRQSYHATPTNLIMGEDHANKDLYPENVIPIN